MAHKTFGVVVKLQVRAQAILGYILLLRLCIFEVECARSSSCPVKNATDSWSQLKNYSRLREVLENALIQGNLPDANDGGHSLMFVNWGDKTLRIRCPETNPNKDYEWEQHCLVVGADNSTNECTKFTSKHYSGRNFVIEFPKRCGDEGKVFRTYSCKIDSNNCRHYVHVFIRPLPVITPPNDQSHIKPQESGILKCKVFRCKEKGPSETDTFSITWRGPNGNILLDNGSLPHVTFNHAENEEASTLAISYATDENVGNYECILTSLKYNISSVPSDFAVNDKRNETCDWCIRSGVKNRVCIRIASRSDWYAIYPCGVIVILLAILAILIKCLPTNENEADVDNDDDEDAEPRLRIHRVSTTGGGGRSSGTAGNITLRSMTIVESEKNER